ncbi:uncharacterized protein M6B38_126765 [Iris pallida]|uniref:Uncharacterized protein n=1 Tax=Iris pallida TaxID=29817 RepID=A0AAX6GD42_IRIPA|nr:uncharacterized protein M6B38_371175 [Iris pallida]KAJ6827531.1 uncharacterized protein M6B38_126765 [Iris pallida]
MARKVVHRHTDSTSSTASIITSRCSSVSCADRNRHQPAAAAREHAPKPSARFAEVAGGTAAECAAVCCCCPCGLVGLVVCALVKLPAGLCRRAIVRRRRRRIARKKSVLLASAPAPAGVVGPAEETCVAAKRKAEEERWVVPAAEAPSVEAAEMEREMMARFYGTGFWRSPSQREDR